MLCRCMAYHYMSAMMSKFLDAVPFRSPAPPAGTAPMGVPCLCPPSPDQHYHLPALRHLCGVLSYGCDSPAGHERALRGSSGPLRGMRNLCPGLSGACDRAGGYRRYRGPCLSLANGSSLLFISDNTAVFGFFSLIHEFSRQPILFAEHNTKGGICLNTILQIFQTTLLTYRGGENPYPQILQVN